MDNLFDVSIPIIDCTVYGSNAALLVVELSVQTLHLPNFVPGKFTFLFVVL